jgi:DNA-binding response OmpR family regulator
VPRVLVADDDPTVLQVLSGYLRRAGMDPVAVDGGEEAVAALGRDRFDVVLLDVMMGEPDGLAICRSLRSDPATARIPILLLTALGEELDRITGLESGADDYVTKPFSPREVTLRVESLLRRTNPAIGPSGRLSSGPVELDPAGRRAWLDSTPLSLTMREFDLLAFLVAHPGEVFPRDQLMSQVWGWSFGDESTVTVHVRRLREKVEADPSRPVLLSTVWGAGYRWDTPEAGAR